jgi:hypothetical protein
MLPLSANDKKQRICNMNKDMASLFRIIEDKWLEDSKENND